MWVHWCMGTVVYGYIGIWVQWYVGTLVYGIWVNFCFSIVERWNHQIINEYFTKVSKCSQEKDLMKLHQLITEIVL